MNNTIKICHIVNWYPNKWNDKEAIWTKRHIDGLNTHCKNDVFHVQLKYGKWGKHFYKISENETAFIWKSNTNIWFIRELLTTILLVYVLLFKIKRKNYDAFNFQITYPLLTYSKLITWLIKKPLIVTEHWSAYHLNFGTTKNLKRIKKIFSNKKLSFICVSDALRVDIEKFSGVKIKYNIVSNTIDTKVFYNKNIHRKMNCLFMLSYWKEPKNPFLLLEVLAKLKFNKIEFKMMIGGFGPQFELMKKKIEILNLNNEVFLLGELNKEQIVEQFNNSSYFIHNSNYEVSSLVCMESLACGTPVIASNVGGIKEYITIENGVLVDNNDFESWYTALYNCLVTYKKYDYNMISDKAKNLFSDEIVSQEYFNILNNKINS
jgi:L-malate glycosyltransferase